jgi:hypothetical protein
MLRTAVAAAALIVLPLAAAGHSEEELAQWQKAATPGAPHEELAREAGSWTYVVTMWDGPDAEPMQLGGIARKQMVMGGRYLQEEVSGSFMGQEFDGFGVTGYDNVAGEYVSIWFDNHGTAIQQAKGKDDGTGTLVFRGEFLAPSGTKVKTRSLTRTIDADHHTYESYMTKPGEKEHLHMRVEYTRAGS